MEASHLHEIVKKFVNFYKSQGLQLPDELLNLIALTINGTLYNDQQSMHPQITDYALQIIYDTIKLLHEKNLWNGINSALFNQKNTRIFIFPGQPRREGWKFVFGDFEFLGNTIPKHCFPLDNVQHVVHDMDDVLTILLTFSGKAHFKGFLHEDFSGPPLCWFSPLPVAWTDRSRSPCDSLDPTGSRYGCYRFTIPFQVLIQRFPKCFILGTRKYNQEHSHTILLTEQAVEYITLIEKRQPVKLTDTHFIRRSQQSSQNDKMHESFEWLCFHDGPWPTEWDHLEFAIATKELQFDPITDNIRLDFVDHSSKICVPLGRSCPYKLDKNIAMQHFFYKLAEKNIQLDTFRAFFTDTVWNELLAVKQSLRLTMYFK